MSHNNFGHHLVNGVTKTNGAIIIQCLRVSVFRDESDEGLVKLLRNSPCLKYVLDFFFNRFSN